MHSLNQMN